EERLVGAFSVRIDRLRRHRRREFLEQTALFLRQFLRDGDARDDVEVAMAAARHVRHSLGAQLEPRARLRAGADFDRLFAVQERHPDLAAERERRKRDRHLAVEVVLFAMEERVLLHVDDDVEIARGAAGGAVLAFAIQAQPLAGRNAGRDLRGDLALASDASGAPARLARPRDHLAAAVARRARARDGEKPLLEAQLARAAALAAHFRSAARRRPRSPARLAGFFARDLDRRFRACVRLFKRDIEVEAQIGAALRAAAAAAAEHVPEPEEIAEAAEDVLEAGECVWIEAPRAHPADAGVTVPVVRRALLRIAQHGVGLGRFLEPLFRLWIAGVLVGVVLD